MTLDMLRTELGRAEDAELYSDEQLRQLTDLIDKTTEPNPAMNASDLAKVVSSALALNDRLRTRTEKIKKDILTEESKVRAAAEKIKSDACVLASYARLNATGSSK